MQRHHGRSNRTTKDVSAVFAHAHERTDQAGRHHGLKAEGVKIINSAATASCR
jgi:hypothetical protein